jgi:uncharacterized protein YbjT (DUF2867 family)
MRIAITGGTGTLGRMVAEDLDRRGHEVRVLSRGAPRYRVDLSTGEGLDAALADCATVIDASNAASARQAEQILVRGSGRLLEAEQRAGVRHHICVSIVGCERIPLGYFRAKAEQERVVEQGPVPWTIVRATQFHELAEATLAAAGRRHVLPLPSAVLQTVACVEVASAVADVAEKPPMLGRVEVAGPEVTDARALAATWRSVTGTRAVRLPVPLPGSLGRALRGGMLTTADPDVIGQVTFGSWLSARAG